MPSVKLMGSICLQDSDDEEMGFGLFEDDMEIEESKRSKEEDRSKDLESEKGRKSNLSRKKKKKQEDTVDLLVSLQKSNGIFVWDNELVEIFGLKRDALAGQFQGITEDIWLTLLIVAYMKIKEANKREFWELVVGKAKKSVKKNYANQDNLDKIGKIAEEIIHKI